MKHTNTHSMTNGIIKVNIQFLFIRMKSPKLNFATEDALHALTNRKLRVFEQRGTNMRNKQTKN